MEKDNAIRDQKVFIRLKAVLEIQKMYTEITQKYGEARNAANGTTNHNTATLAAHKRAMEQMIRTLELPINLPIGA